MKQAIYLTALADQLSWHRRVRQGGRRPHCFRRWHVLYSVAICQSPCERT